MKNVVIVGGGSGIFNVLRGLKKYPLNLTAIVTTFDNGGSTGVLRDEFGTLPAGDIRRALIALAPDDGNTALRDLFLYRFDKHSSLNGHSFGNLLIKALTDIAGDEARGLDRAATLLNIKGRVLPVSVDDAHVCAQLSDGFVVKGETNIDIPKHDGALRIERIYLEPLATIFRDAYEAIANADAIIIGPGDLYTSIIPNLAVLGFKEAISDSHAPIFYVVNAMTKWGETHGFTASDFVRTVTSYLGRKKVDVAVCNNAPIEDHLCLQYAKENAFPVVVDKKINDYAYTVIKDDVIYQNDIIRHDARKIARVIVDLLLKKVKRIPLKNASVEQSTLV